jgi:hypothetical protein
MVALRFELTGLASVEMGRAIVEGRGDDLWSMEFD